MGLIQNLAVVALFSGAYISNPDEESFKRHLETELRRGHASWLEAKIASAVTSSLIQRENYYFFSIIKVPTERLTYFGVFSKWFLLPPSLGVGPSITS